MSDRGRRSQAVADYTTIGLMLGADFATAKQVAEEIVRSRTPFRRLIRFLTRSFR